MLTKSAFLQPRQCPRRLWRFVHQGTPPPDADGMHRIAVGKRIGRLAQALFPTGVAVMAENKMDRAAATLAAMQTEDILFEATFVAEDCEIRADILVREGDGWAIWEVKSGLSVKPAYLEDLSFQVFVLQRAGVKTVRAGVIHPNRRYVHPGGDQYDPRQFLVQEDVTEAALKQADAMADDVTLAREVIARADDPDPLPSTYCRDCDHLEGCQKPWDSFPVWMLPKMQPKSYDKFAREGILTVDDAAVDAFGKSAQLAVQSHQTNQKFTDPRFQAKMKSLAYPIGYVDFEAVQEILPQFPGHTPSMRVPFQWSLHIRREPAGETEHYEYLPEHTNEPRAEFTASLWEAIKDCRTVVVYSGYEAQTIGDLAKQGIPFGEQLNQHIKATEFDLLDAIRKYTYWPEYAGRFSLKNVLPAVTDVSYKDLEINNGALAMIAYLRLLEPTCPPTEAARIRENLRAYCKRDTEAMVALMDAFTSATPGWSD